MAVTERLEMATTEHERNIAETKRMIRESKTELENLRRNEQLFWEQLKSMRDSLRKPSPPPEAAFTYRPEIIRFPTLTEAFDAGSELNIIPSASLPGWHLKR
jgi:uncharacterized coiled-coil protein SlyX